MGHSGCLDWASDKDPMGHRRRVGQHLDRRQCGHSTEKVLKTFKAYELLLIDELGFLPLDKEESDLFFQLISRRYEQGSVVLTTNRPFKQWSQIFNDNTVASAILDRLVHHCLLARIGGNSYRLRDQKENLDKPD